MSRGHDTPISTLKELSGERKDGLQSPEEDSGLDLWQWKTEASAHILTGFILPLKGLIGGVDTE